MWLDLKTEIAAEFAALVTFDVDGTNLSVRKARTSIEAERKAYKAAWARAKYRRDAAFRAEKVAADCARYHAKKVAGK